MELRTKGINVLGGMVALLLLTSTQLRASESDSYSGDSFEEKRLSIRLSGGPALQSLSVGGNSGFVSSVPFSFAANWGGEVRIGLGSNGFQTRLRYRQISGNLSGLTSLSPSTTSVVRNQGSVLFGGKLFQAVGGGFFEKLFVGFGGGYYRRAADLTAPNQIVTPSTDFASLLHFGYASTFSDLFAYEVIAELGLPFSHRESSQVSGNFGTGYFGEIGMNVAYTVTEVLSVAAGVTLRRESFSYGGSGNRGTSDALDAANLILLPFEVRFNF